VTHAIAMSWCGGLPPALRSFRQKLCHVIRKFIATAGFIAQQGMLQRKFNEVRVCTHTRVCVHSRVLNLSLVAGFPVYY
jgi:hypothetical protein